jgi:HlyD family secretion protein
LLKSGSGAEQTTICFRREDAMKKWLIVAGAAYAYWSKSDKTTGSSYRLVSLEKGDLEAVVSATGTLQAVRTVEVGTQISGRIVKLYADFNDTVKKGQVIAQLDTTLLQSAVEDAQASLESRKAQLAQADRELKRQESLHSQGIASDSDLNNAQYAFDVANAAVKSADAALDRARQNLDYATITAPVSGTVIERDVDVGQTVAASLAAPKLFLIANDLSQMQILAAVDESDIGQIHQGQVARFTVKAYPERQFTGTVQQVRLQSTVDQNVVSYNVVINVANRERTLLPGMTATVEFLVAQAKDVLKIANSALRFRPTEQMVQELRERRRQARAAAGEHGPAAGGESARGQGREGWRQRAAEGRPPDVTMLWYLDASGKPEATPVHTGITDGQYTEVSGRKLEPGMKIIAGITEGTQAAEGGNPFQRRQESPFHRAFGF